MQTLAAGLVMILWGMRDYAHADGNGNHGNSWRIRATTKKLGQEFIRCTLQQLGGWKIWSWAIVYGILAWIPRDHRAAMQHRITKEM